MNEHRISTGVGVCDILPGIDLDLLAGGMFEASQDFANGAVAGLFSLSALQQLWRSDRRELAVALAALMGAGLLQGVLIGAVISLVQLLRRASRPHVAVLGRIPGTRRFSDAERHPDNELIPGVLIVRPESALLYFNVDYVRDTILDRTRTAATPPQFVVLDLSASPVVDLQGSYALAGLADELAAVGIRVQVVEARSSVRDRLRCDDVDAKLGGVDRSLSVTEAVDALRKQANTGLLPFSQAAVTGVRLKILA